MLIMQLPNNNWRQSLSPLLDFDEMTNLNQQVQQSYANHKMAPANESDIFNAYAKTDIDDVKVVLIGQTPKIENNTSNGLAFSTQPNTPLTPSLTNIFIERQNDIAIAPTTNGDLTNWTKQGVFLLNTELTHDYDEGDRRQSIDWQSFTDATIKAIDARNRPTVYILLGKKAQDKLSLIQHTENALIIVASHPSPLSAHKSFFGSNMFSRTNAFLTKHHLKPIDWSN